MEKAIFLDKDGTLIHNIPYNTDPEFITFLPGVVAGLRAFQSLGFLLVIVTNQSGIARGYFTEKDFTKAKQYMEVTLSQLGIYMDGFYMCPHHPEAAIGRYRRTCMCRKPMPGMIHNAARDLSIQLSKSWMIGDILNDVEAGNRAGCKTILIDNGNEDSWMVNALRSPYCIVSNFQHAVHRVQKDSERTRPYTSMRRML